MAPHSSTLAWKIPWMEEPGALQSMGSLEVRQDWETSLSLFTFMHWRRKWQPTPVYLPGESQGWGSLWAAVYGVTQSQTRLTWLSSSSSSIPMYFILFIAMVNGIVSLISLSIFSFLLYVLAIFKSAAVNIGVHMSSSVMVSLGIWASLVT